MDGETLAVRNQSIVWERKLEFDWVRDRAQCAQWWNGEASFSRAILRLLEVETSPLHSEPVVEGESESARSKHSGLCRSSNNKRRNPGVLVS